MVNKYPVQFDEYQSNVIYSPDKHIIAIARAGSGKSTVLTKRAELLNQEHPGNTLLISFNREIVEENAKYKLRNLIETSKFSVRAQTIHALALEILNLYKNYKLKLINKNTYISFYLTLLNSISDFHINKLEHLYWIDSNLPNPFSYTDLNKLLVKTSGYFSLEQTAELITLFRKERQRHDYILVEEILEKARLIPEHYWQSLKVTHLLIDEAQDITTDQLTIVRNLVTQAETVTVVMDNWQEIYTWAGSNSNSLIQHLTQLKPFTFYPLLYNYRSNLEIVNLSNCLLLSSKESKLVKPTKPTGGKVQHITEKQFGQLIQELHSNQDLDNTVVLYRNYKCLKRLKHYLNNIPYFVNQPVYSKTIEFLFNHYRLLFYINPPKDIWISVIKTYKLLDISLSEYIWEATKGRPLLGIAIPNQPFSTRVYQNFCTNLRILKNHILNTKLENTLDLILKFTNTNQLSNQEKELLLQYKTLFKRCVGIYDLLKIIDSKNPRFMLSNTLLLSTIHKSKGLEFKRVFLWAEELLGRKKLTELKLEYVAVTRAISEFYFVGDNLNSSLYNLLQVGVY